MSTQLGVERRDLPIAGIEPRRRLGGVRLPVAAAAETTAIWAIAFWWLLAQTGPEARLVASLAFALAFVASTSAARGMYARVDSISGGGVAVGVGACTAGVLTAAGAFALPGLRIDPRGLILTVLLASAAELLCRAVTVEAEPASVLVVGGGDGTDELIEALTAGSRSRFRIVAAVADAPLGLSPSAPHWRIDDLAWAVRETQPELVVVAVDRGRPRVFEQLADVAEEGFHVVGLPEFFEHAYGRVPVRHLSPAWFMSVLHLYQRPYSRTAKRAFDIAVALAALVLILPLLPVIALFVLTGGRPIIFRQTRLGEHGRLFTIYKFRTMRQDAERHGAVWAADEDPRVTPFGRVLRKARLDELPQLWNVLRGDMSIVGPRPERPEFLPRLEEAVPYWTRRHLLKPGITGWAQISSGYSDDEIGTIDKLSYDLWYLRHRSMLVDLLICLRTFPRLFDGEGAR